MSQVLGAFGLLDFICYGPLSFGARFETYEPFISLIFQFFGLRQTADTESADPGAQLYICIYICIYVYIYLRENLH
jgi:uncharacterized MAPEG superfamily protein